MRRWLVGIVGDYIPFTSISEASTLASGGSKKTGQTSIVATSTGKRNDAYRDETV